MDLKTLIAYNIDFQLEKTGYSRTRDSNYRNFSRADEEILQAALKISSQLENDARFSGILASFQTFGVSKESFLYVLDQLLVGEINWARIMSVVTLSGTLAVQCMENNEEYKTDLIQDWASSFAEVKLKIWMDNNNGLVNIISFSL